MIVKKTRKCNECDGEGRIKYSSLEGVMVFRQCKSCKGKRTVKENAHL